MPKKPKSENEDNPLRQLRELLASPGRARISQPEFAQICGISANTIKKIEFGSRSLNPSILTKIRIATGGAQWGPEDRRWTRNGKDPFTFADFSEHRKRVLNPSAIDQAIKAVMVDLIHRRIEWLFENIPAKSWEGLRSRLNIFLEECKRELRITANDALFYRPASLGSANESAAAQPVKPEQQKHEHVSNRRGQRGAIAGNKKRRRKYGP